MKRSLCISALVLSVGFIAAPTFAGKHGTGTGGPGGGSNQKKQQQQPQDPPPPAETPAPPPTSQPAVDNTALRKAQADLSAAQAAAKSRYESDPAFTGALADLRSAESDYETSVKPVVSSVKKSGKYLAASDAEDKAEAKLAQLQTADTPDSNALTAAAEAKRAARDQMKSLEQQAIASDSAASAAQQKLTTAQAKMAKLRADEPKVVSADPAVMVAKDAVDAAKKTS